MQIRNSYTCCYKSGEFLFTGISLLVIWYEIEMEF
jgi:hypothetical protein